LADDHRRAVMVARALAEIPSVKIDLETVQTNIILFELSGEFQTVPFVDALKERGVLMLSLGGGRIRAVTHLDISDGDIKTAIKAIQEAAPAA
jgi:threonine aldolase